MRYRFSLRSIHLWSGLLLIIPIIFISISGTILLFSQTLIEARLPQLWQSDVPIKIEKVAQDLRQIDVLSGTNGWRLARLPDESRPYYAVWLHNGERAYIASGQTQFADQFSPLSRPETLLYEIHAHLLGGDTGEVVIAWLGLILFINCIIGFILWWPIRRSSRVVQLWPVSMSRGKLLRAHMTWGSIFIFPILLAVMSGVMAAFPKTTQSIFVTLLGGEKKSLAIEPTPHIKKTLSWQKIIETADAAFENDRLIYLIKPKPNSDDPIYIRSRIAGEWHPNGRSEIYIDPNTGTLLNSIRAQDLGLGRIVSHSIYPIHSAQGSARGLWPALLIAGIALFSTSIMAGITYYKRLLKPKN